MRKLISFFAIGATALVVSFTAFGSDGADANCSCCSSAPACSCACNGNPDACTCSADCGCTSCGAGCCGSR